MNDDLKRYLATLTFTHEDPTPAPSPPSVSKHVPLDQQITELMRSLPPHMRDRPWSMSELVQRLQGKFRQRPHGQQVGEALLRYGWTKERRYAAGWDGRRVWLPPNR
jgi:hypothetical protein